MADTKQTKTIGEHHVAAALARREWAPAFTRDGLERTDILAVRVEGAQRHMIEVQVKAARGPRFYKTSWPLGRKALQTAAHRGEFYVLVAAPSDQDIPPRFFMIPRDHLAAATWIVHEDWRTDPTAAPGTRNADVSLARIASPVFERYEYRWYLLDADQATAPVLLAPRLRDLAQDDRIGIPEGPPWQIELPEWDSDSGSSLS